MAACSALTPYTPPITAEEFVQSEINRNGSPIASLGTQVVLPGYYTRLIECVAEAFAKAPKWTLPDGVITYSNASKTSPFEKIPEPYLGEPLDLKFLSGPDSLQIDCFPPFEAVQIDSSSYSESELLEVRRALAEGVQDAIAQIMSNEKNDIFGVWYPSDFEVFFESRGMSMPDEYWTGYAHQGFFDKTDQFTFRLKSGQKASDGVKALLRGPSVLDCGNATQLAYYDALLGFLGVEKFDQLFSGNPFTLSITQRGITCPESPISRLAHFTENAYIGEKGTLGHRPLEIGDECHIKGVPFYPHKHPVGFSGGWNVIHVGHTEDGQQLFMAHGFDTPKTEREINCLLTEGYNQERTSHDELYIEASETPALHDRERFSPLMTFYTIPIDIADTAVEGFIAGSIRNLDPVSVLMAKTHPIDGRLALKLINRKIARLAAH